MNTRWYRNTGGWILASAVRLSGAIRRAHFSATNGGGTLALFFHDPPREQFVRVVGWFKAHGYRFLCLDEIEECLIRGKSLPSGSVWISLDDAWRRNLTEVIPVAREWNIPITIFVPTASVVRGTFWFSHALKHASALPEPFRNNARQLWRERNAIRCRIVEDLFERVPPREREVMTIEEVAELAKVPQVTIGSHSVQHAILPTCTEQELQHEIVDSKRELEQWTGRSIRAFSYPNGDVDIRATRLLAEAGYSLAFTTEAHPIKVTDDRYRLPRCSIMDDGSLSENLCHAFGLWSSLIQLVRRPKPYPRIEDLYSGGSELLPSPATYDGTERANHSSVH